jgi:hypothetical protein
VYVFELLYFGGGNASELIVAIEIYVRIFYCSIKKNILKKNVRIFYCGSVKRLKDSEIIV